MTAATTIRIDPELKREAQALYESFGLTLSAAINLFLRQSIREQAIPFRVGEPVYNEETLRTVQEARRGENVDRAYATVDEFWKAFEAGETDEGA
ncbi:MAG: type II toxin-antitoxin system RelB/DinJ family antitoxin [Oscillibacter sp.]|nr:type II toxin-antitoxin system RelB/DinJ family antitoxin [Oscillibacter sp.]